MSDPAPPPSGETAPPTPGDDESLSLVDVHTHVVSPDEDRYPLDPRPLSGDWYRTHPASGEDLLREMDAHGVDGAVLVQGVGAYGFDNRYAADAAADAPGRFTSAACIDVEAPDALEQVDHWLGERGMAGLRFFALAREGRSWLTDPGTFPVWERVLDLGGHPIVTILDRQLDELDRVLTHFAGTSVSLDHCAFATGDPGTREGLLALARHPGLHLKVSTHNLDEAEASGEGASALMRALADRFGAERLMWGSDFCQVGGRDYGELVALGRAALAGLSASERAEVASGTARRLWPALAQ